MKTHLFLTLTTWVICSSAQAQTTAPTPAASPASAPDATQASAAAYQSIDPAKAAEIRKMIELAGTVKAMNQVMEQMITTFKTRNSNVPKEFWDRFESEMNTTELIDKMIPLYDKYYSLEDLKAVNAFYESPAGQRMLAAMPQIRQESMQIGQEWGKEMGMKIVQELAQEKQKEAASATPASPSPSASTPTPAPTSTTPSPPATPPASKPSGG